MNKKNTCIVCYEDINTGALGWANVNLVDLDNWKNANPAFAPKYMFSQKGDILARDDSLENNFNHLYAHYGLDPDSLTKTYSSPNGHTVIIKGIAVNNRKYPIIIEDLTSNRRFKVSTAYAAKLVEVTT